MSEDIAVRRARSRYKTIVCSFCLAQVDDACFAWASGVCICTECIKFATEEVAKAKKTQEIAEDIGKLVTKLTVAKEDKKNIQIPQSQIVAEIKSILEGPAVPHEFPDDVA